MLRGRAPAGLVAGLMILGSTDATAYRPFDGTDAAVTEPGTFEVELGPAEYVREADEQTLIAPNLRLNYGFARGWEAVIEGQTAHQFPAMASRTSQVGNAVSLKRVLREGVLQGQAGPSIATEFGLLLPGIDDEHGTGGSIAGILSQRWEPLTLHLNAAVALTRQQHGDVFLSTIIEGPHDWMMRPVAEFADERDFGRFEIRSTLLGGIWQVRENLAFDIGLRGGTIHDHSLAEVRAGLTFSFSVSTHPNQGDRP